MLMKWLVVRYCSERDKKEACVGSSQRRNVPVACGNGHNLWDHSLSLLECFQPLHARHGRSAPVAACTSSAVQAVQSQACPQGAPDASSSKECPYRGYCCVHESCAERIPQ